MTVWLTGLVILRSSDLIEKLPNQAENTESGTIAAVIVTFNPQLQNLRQNILAVFDQVDQVVIIDNGSENQASLRDLLETLVLEKVVLRCLNVNQGIGAAHNHGIAIAKESQHDYVLLLDQDSLVNSDMVDVLYDAVLQLVTSGEASTLAAVGACYTGDNSNDSFFVRFGWLKFQRQYCLGTEHGVIPADFLISSGSLIPMKVIDHIGGMDDSLFIDHVDTEWFLRAKAAGLQAYGICQAKMQHGLGEQMHRVRFFGVGRERHVPQHKPFRYYYMFRNSFALYRRNNLSRKWKWNDMQRLMQIFLFYGVCYGPRLKNLTMMFRGMLDGLRNKMGKLPD